MGITRELFKKTRDIKGIFHATMGTIKDIKGRIITEAEEIKRKWQEDRELYKKKKKKKVLMTQITMRVWSLT